MQFAVIYHPEDISEVRLSYPLLRRIPDSLLRRFLPYLPPNVVGLFQTEEGSSGQAIICPLLPEHFNTLAPVVINQKINSCLKKAEKLEAQVIGLEGLLGPCLEGGLLDLTQIKPRLTSGVLLKTVAMLQKARLAAEQLGLNWTLNNVVLAGALGQEGETWIRLLAEEVQSLTLVRTDAGWDKGFVSRIIYETGLALKLSTDCGSALSQADIVFFHHLRPEDIEVAYTIKPGALVCSLLPYSGWKEKLQGRSDITYLENPALKPLVALSWEGKQPNYPRDCTTLAETLILGREQIDELNCSNRDITIRQIKIMSYLAGKYVTM